MTATSCRHANLLLWKKHVGPFTGFPIIPLSGICISWHDRVPNILTLDGCNTLSAESHLQSKGLRWLRHVFRMPDVRLPKRLLFGQVKRGRPLGGSGPLSRCFA